MSLTDQGVYVRFAPLPINVEGVTLPNDNGTYDVYINSNLSEEHQLSVLRHELKHINLNHMYDFENCVAVQELAANM